ncbi:E3 ubiquitin-protein ligase ZNF598 [Hippoglossus stenolepis]|uniref:E3 ubiquitin-protein ligase ZNF598 n=1 Tax=Hippoglossus stenolepis TaxID=195615 RepID=UPI001FAFE6F3|nr:E3 ubiquitin-protein ligase ZNF598 [Hippoglossus stenolepis]
MAPTPAKETERHCVLCCQEVDIFALGKCDHPVCYRCSTKMRALCEQKYCAVCREELDKVVFVKKLEAFSSLPFQQFACEKKHDIYFGDERIHAQYRHLMLSECVRCPEPKIFARFEELEQHMRKQHELFCCKLCSKHLKIFTHERKWYNRKELARHRAHGDPDDTSHRGHPLCKFCDDRYLDNDELLKHLRRDHYFCHFCDADGSQEYYSDYLYLSEHFRESHYLCEEGRCASEQFTHAFRSEIDYKAHKAGAHSKNRAEARQNRHIDLQFNYAPRPQRRNEGVMTGEDYEEMRHNRGGRGRPHGGGGGGGGGGQKSWRYSREDEDRQMEAAMRASMAMSRQEERGAVQERSTPKHCREERTKRIELEEPRHRNGPIEPTTKPPVRTMKSSNPGEEDDFPVLGATAAIPIVKPAPVVVPVAPVALKEDDFPSLSAVAVTSLMTPAYSAPPRKTSSFQEEDFPALVSKLRPLRPTAGTKSAWSSKTAVAKPVIHPPPSSRQPPPLSSASSGPQLLSSSASLSSRRKKKVGENGKAVPLSSDDESGGLTQQEFRSVPTMLDISSLLTVKGGSSNNSSSSNSNSKPSTMTSSPSNLTPNPDVFTSKASKKKKPQKNTAAPSSSVSSTVTTPVNTISVETAAQKENVPEKKRNKPLSSTVTAAPMSGLTNGHTEKSPPISKETVAVNPPPNTDPPLHQEEDFPALMTKKPPPGFKSSFPMKASAPASSSTMPPPPPGLGLSGPKPPPGFTGIPLNSNVVEPAPSAVNLLPKLSSSGYLVPEDFHQRNLELIQSIRMYLRDDETKFNQFKNYSAQFRQGVVSGAQYHCSCKDLLGEDFNCIFNELLVLLPDTGKQQELLSAHADCKALEKQSGSGGGKKNKNKKNAWQMPTSVASIAAELECQVCPTCRQVLARKDFNSHKTLHIRDTDEFPSLQSISRIIS